MVWKVFALAGAGALGTLARAGVGALAGRLWPHPFPFGTLAVNLTGCFLAGCFWALFEHRWAGHPELRAVVLVGFFGAFTTFSAYALEAAQLFTGPSPRLALAHLVLQNGLGLALAFAGMALGRSLTG